MQCCNDAQMPVACILPKQKIVCSVADKASASL